MANRIVILGAGESGVGAALLAKAKGYIAFVSDMGEIKPQYREILEKEKIEFESGTHTEEKIVNAAVVVKSPGIPDKAPIVKKIREKGIDVISEIEFASRFTKAKFIAITGSNGKTTTTLLTYHLLKKMGLNVGLAGNVGQSLAKQVLEDNYDYFVLELSSFQLDGMYKFRAHVAVLLNITPDHLDRYEYKFQNYIDSKFRIIQNMDETDYFITLTDDENIRTELEKKRVEPTLLAVSVKEKMLNGAYLSGDTILVNVSKDTPVSFSLDTSSLPLQGKHNMINAMAAILVGAALGLKHEQFVSAIADFKNAAHRLEEAGTVNGIRYVNDSKATNVDSVWYALDSFKDPIVLIAGGVDKGNDYRQIEELVRKKVKALVCMGKDNAKLVEFFTGKVPEIKDTHSIQEAVAEAAKLADKGDIVLLSPACASFDLFKNYEDRGEQFKQQVKNLMQQSAIK